MQSGSLRPRAKRGERVSRQHDEVVFEFVSRETRPAKPKRKAKATKSEPRAAKRAAPRPRFDAPSFPLVGPILERSNQRLVRGVCSKCNTRLRVRVKGRGPVRVTCPICGHARRVQL